MPNMRPDKNPMPEQAAQVRKNNFDEVALGYSAQAAMDEANRCLNCKHKPCVAGCPVNVRIPEFIEQIQKGEFVKAYEVIRQTNSLPAVCGRVCPQETQCEQRCVRAKKGESVGIGRLERFAADQAMVLGVPETEVKPDNGRRVAIIGSGPASLSCAGDLRKLGYDVTIFEALHVAGGVLMYGIPEFRLPKALVQKEIDSLRDMGVKIITNFVIGRSMMVDELMGEEGFEAVFIGSGAGLPNFQKIPGEGLNGVYSANEFLTRVNLMRAYTREATGTPVLVGSRVAVIGGGNVAMDAARSALRMGAGEVTIIYRRSFEEMPARREEVHHAKEEGVLFRLLCAPKEILGDKDGFVTGLRVVEMALGEPDERGRRRPIEKPGSEAEIPMDTVIVAIGNSPNPLIKKTTPDIETKPWGGLVIDEETGATSKPGVFAGGDTVTGAATVILAMGAGKTAAKGIHAYLNAKEN